MSRLIDDPDLAYVMTRYREVHDFLHVLTGLPPTVEGELILKTLEAVQTCLPMPVLSAMAGPLSLQNPASIERYYRSIAPQVILWAIGIGAAMLTPCTTVKELLCSTDVRFISALFVCNRTADDSNPTTRR